MILDKYLDFLNVFIEKKAAILPEITNSNHHAIKLQKGDQSPYI